MECVADLLADARSAGLAVRIEDERLVVRGPKQQADLAGKILDRKSEVRALLERDEHAIQERMAVLRPLVPLSGPIPFLVVRSQEAVPPGHCLSCGEPLGDPDGFRCRLCVEAMRRVLAEVDAVRRAQLEAVP